MRLHPDRLDASSASPSTAPTATSGSSTCSPTCPAAQLGFLIVVNILVFMLGFFLDFFELAFIVDAAAGAGGRRSCGIDLIWFGVLLGDEHADLVHARRRSASRCSTCAAWRRSDDYKDRVTGATIPAVSPPARSTGARSPFIVIQLHHGRRWSSPSRRWSTGDAGDQERGRHRQPSRRSPDRRAPTPAGAGRRPPASRSRRAEPADERRRRRSRTSEPLQALPRRRAATQKARRRRRRAPPARARKAPPRPGLCRCRRAARRVTSFCACMKSSKPRLGEAEPQVLRRCGTST
ncbi:MAG: TRAP transporter large permease subunit [Chromatiales bacterium]|nr:TRAP transporter large permease subunit [Chromatiales bacterium]